MLTSGKLLSDALEKYRKKKERFSTGDSISAGAVSAIDTGLLVFAIIFFVMEIILIFYAIIIAFLFSYRLISFFLFEKEIFKRCMHFMNMK